MSMRKFASIAFTIALFASCDGTPKNAKANADSDSTKTEVAPKVDLNRHYSNSLNQTARIVAGINVASDTMFSKVRTSTTWTKYAAESSEQWAAYETRNANLYTWVGSEVLPRTTSLNTVMYPFSGPDFLYGNLIFPDATTIYMFGLEEIGSVPDFSKINTAQIDEYITFYKKSIREVLKDSFYHTKGMKVYLDNANIDGVVPVLMLFMAQRGKQISEVNHLTINEDGTLKTVPNDTKFKKLANRGVEIKYYNGTDNTERRVIFFTGNIADGGLGENPAYAKYYKSLHPEGAFIKSATYLLHKPYFSIIRNVLLENCKTIVSDDSGIAYKFYEPTKWDVQLYGTYTKPIGLFDNLYEQDLYDAYRKDTKSIKPLNFRIGYSSPSNMRIAIKK